jgi:hypothetical protein
MKTIAGIFFLATLAMLSRANAQQMQKGPATDSDKPAVANPSNDVNSPAAPVPGKNSFTKGEAKKRLQKHGYSAVSALAKDENSVWHAKAQKAGRAVNVTLDYQGNITEE